MGISPCLSAMGIVVCAIMISLPAPVVAQEKVAPPPSDAELKQQLTRLENNIFDNERLEAIKWIERHAGAPNVHLAIPRLEQCIRADPNPLVRDAAVDCRAEVAKKRREPCPLVIVEAILDQDEMVSQSADCYAAHFSKFAPGCVEVLLRCAQSENDRVRHGGSLNHLAYAAGKDKRALEAIEKAMNDKSFGVRHNAHIAMFHANDNLEQLLTYFIRLQQDPDGVLGQVDKTTEDGKREVVIRDMVQVGSVGVIVEWSDKRAEDLAAALVKLLGSESPQLRRGAAYLIGASARKIVWPTGTAMEPDWKKFLDPPEKPVQPQKPPEKSKAAFQFEKLKVEDRLRELFQNDTDETVRAAAGIALERLRILGKKQD